MPSDEVPCRAINLEQVYPDPASSLAFDLAKLVEIRDNAIVALDTNVLLLPYKKASKSFPAIVEHYRRLASRGQLAVPAQVLREFLHHRGSHLVDVIKELHDLKSKSIPPQPSHPFLKLLGRSADMERKFEDLNSSWREAKATLIALVEEIRTWNWDDPVSQTYQKIFTAPVVVHCECDEGSIRTELERRKKYHMPPGYKDTTEKDLGGGDLIIWMTLLKLAESRKKHLIFVTQDAKADWFYRSGSESVYARFELTEEYRRASGGKSFHLLNVGRFLQLYGERDDVIESLSDDIDGAGRWNELEVRSTALEWVLQTSGGHLVDPKSQGMLADAIIEYDDKSVSHVFVTLVNSLHEIPEQLPGIGEKVDADLSRSVAVSNAMVVFALRSTDVADYDLAVLRPYLRRHKTRFVVGFIDDKRSFVPTVIM